jgi:hypothetical protein
VCERETEATTLVQLGTTQSDPPRALHGAFFKQYSGSHCRHGAQDGRASTWTWEAGPGSRSGSGPRTCTSVCGWADFTVQNPATKL